MSKIPSTVILFNCGAYGTFVNWAIEYFSGRVDYLPFGTTGDSHGFIGTQIESFEQVYDRLSDGTYHRYIRMHPHQHEAISPDIIIGQFLETVERTVLIYPDLGHFVTNINNKIEKWWGDVDTWLDYPDMQVRVIENIKDWGRCQYTDMERWEQREFLSLCVWEQQLSEVGLNFILNLSHPRLFKLTIDDLFNRFTESMHQLFEFCNEQIVRTNFDEIYDIWYNLQNHKDKDALVHQIVSSTVNGDDFDWGDRSLTLIDEAIIQMMLRNVYRKDLLCYNVNVFPSTSSDLRKILTNA